MISITPAECAVLQQQVPAALATTLATLVFDRSLRNDLPLIDCIRPGWTSRDMSGDEVLKAIFDGADDDATPRRTILVHENANHGFMAITGRVDGEAETECLLLGEGMELFTSAIFQAGWSAWGDHHAGTCRAEVDDFRSAIAR